MSLAIAQAVLSARTPQGSQSLRSHEPSVINQADRAVDHLSLGSQIGAYGLYLLSQPIQQPWTALYPNRNEDVVQVILFLGSRQDQGAYTPPETRLVSGLRALREAHGWQADWNGEGAPAPDPRALDQAETMLSALTPRMIVYPQVVINADGQPTFFVETARETGEIVISGPDTCEFFFTDGDHITSDYDIPFDGELPPSLEDALRAIGAMA